VSTRPAHPYFDKLLDEIRAKQPRFFHAVVRDAEFASRARGERDQFRNRVDAAVQIVRLMCVTDAFVGQVLYRAQARLDALRVPVLPWVAHRLAIMTAQVCIGRTVVVHPGVFIGHGQVVIDGYAEIHPGAVIYPWVTIGLRASQSRGPVIGPDVRIGTGAKVLGPVTLHRGARVGANAVVVKDVPEDVTVVGIPAQPARATPPDDRSVDVGY
jgi:serine O-acetyltransferase